jgi:ELWxxDGT repeat protein
VLGDRLLFEADDGTLGRELWMSDGTLGGTALLKDLSPSGDATVDIIALRPDLAFLAVRTPEMGLEPWRTDGTEAGTFALSDVYAGPGSGLFFPDVYAFYPSLYRPPFRSGSAILSGSDGMSGSEPWITDGTVAGTRLLLDACPGPFSSVPMKLGNAEMTPGGSLLLDLFEPVAGKELWIHDPTSGDTRLFQDIAPGALSSSSSHFTVSGRLVYLRADDGTTGSELWAIPRASPGRVDALKAVKGPSAEAVLSWPASCAPFDGDYAVYEGALGAFPAHLPLTCSTSGLLTASAPPSPVSNYYLVVPRNETSEGDYGPGIPPSATPCAAAISSACN